MAAITAPQIKILWTSGDAGKTVLLAANNVTAADTLDLGPTGASAQFRVVKSAVMIGSTVIGAAAASVSGTVITMPAGLTADSAYILAFGDAF